jgi:hypothetical protein
MNKKNPALDKAKAGFFKKYSRRTVVINLMGFKESLNTSEEKLGGGNFLLGRLCKLATHKKKSFPAISRNPTIPASFLMNTAYNSPKSKSTTFFKKICYI